MSFFDSTNSQNINTSSNPNPSGESCENCSSNFTLFKRKKTCHICRQLFCQSCVNRHQISLNTNNQLSTSSNERICVICQSICLPHTTIDEVMKYKLKHLRSILNAANVGTNTCKEKRDLAELVLRNKTRIHFLNTSNINTSNSHNDIPQTTSQTSQNSQQDAQSNNPSVFNSFMTNVQDFVNFNLNTVGNLSNMQMPPQPMPAPAPASNINTNTNSRSSSSSSNNSARNQNNNDNRNANNGNNNRNLYHRNSTSSQNSSSSNNQSTNPNLNSLFNLISDQVPNVLNQTFTNNQFTFNNLFNGEPAAAASATNNQNRVPNSTPNQQSRVPPTNVDDSTQEHNETMNSANNTNTNTTNENINIDNSNQNSNGRGVEENVSRNNVAGSSSSNIRRRASLSDITVEQDIERLTIKQIKEILACNFVDYKGCCEKKELVDKTKRLYASYLENKCLENEINQAEQNTDTKSNENPINMSNNMNLNNNKTSTSNSSLNLESDQKQKKFDEADLCKICMESLIDCVLLDCGHMVSCIKCGKRLAECPMCRQNIVRVIRVFKS